jgi:hypothetical protein
MSVACINDGRRAGKHVIRAEAGIQSGLCYIPHMNRISLALLLFPYGRRR